MAMMMWAVGFPTGEILLETWGAISLLSVRILLAVGLLMVFWIVAEGMPTVLAAPWGRGVSVGGIGFGFGAILLLVGQKMSDPVTPAIVAAMMPIAGAAIEVVLDKRKLRLQLLGGITLAMMLLIFSLPAIAISQLLWIWASGRLGILLASLHMNAVPFCVMVIIVIFLGDPWGWDQAIGAALVATGVFLAQAPGPKKEVPCKTN